MRSSELFFIIYSIAYLQCTFIYLGFGNGTKKWIIFFNGGAWCFDEQACYHRSHTVYGSSRFDTIFTEGGLYTNDPQTNPDFYNWNMVFILYCDGSSFTGMRQKPVYFDDKPVYFRGKAILDAVIQDLLSRGVRNASDVLLSGSSAGSLAVLIHADFIKSRLNPKTKVRAIADSGYFVDLETQYGINKTRYMFNRMLLTHNSTSSLHQACIKRMSIAQHWKCLFPQYFFDLIKTPVFVLQSAYDVWQIVNNLDIVCTIPNYEDILLFRSLKRLRTSSKTFRRTNPVMTSLRNTPRGTNFLSRKTTQSSRGSRRESRKKSNASLVIIRASPRTKHAQKQNSIFVKKFQWRTSIPTSTREPISRVPRVNNLVPHVTHVNDLVERVDNRGHVQTMENQYPPFRDTFESAHVLTSQIPSVRRSPRWRNSAGTQSSWNNPVMSRFRRPNNRVYDARVKSQLSASVKYQVLRQQNLGDNTQSFPFYNMRETIPAANLPDTNQAYSPRNIDNFRQNAERRSYSVTNANAARFRQKREPENAQFGILKSRNISAKLAQFKQIRGHKKAQSDRPKSRKVNKQTTFKGYHWQTLYSVPASCTKDETEKILNLRKLTTEAMKPVISKPDTGLFLSPCFEHTQAVYSSIWQNTKVKGKNPRDAIAEWYFEKPGNHIHIGQEFEFGSCIT